MPTTTQPIQLSRAVTSDLDTLFQFQTNEEAIHMAAFTSKDPHDRKAYIDKWTRLLSDPSIHLQTIRCGDRIVGSVGKWEMEGAAQITYWLDRKFWGQGIASSALRQFLDLETRRPLFGRVISDNIASQRVMEKCGFERYETERAFANARQQEVEEFVYRLT
jgi:RimJ/RimL family protein N-acetyltransferase